MSITAESAAVFRGGGRRFFTLRAAARAEAKALIKRNCYCERCHHEEWGLTELLPCRRHTEEVFQPLVDRLAARIIREYRRARRES